jgi:hypothetical protein
MQRRVASLLQLSSRRRDITAMKTNLETIPNELLINAHGGAQTWQQLSRFANSHGFTVTSSTGGRHLGWAHRAGRAIDVRTRGHSGSDVNAFMRAARGEGITVIDERRGGNSAWSGPHLHLQR